MTKPTRPAFMVITSTGGYIGRIYWTNSGVHPDFPRWGDISFIPDSPVQKSPFMWASDFPIIQQVINWRFYDHD